MNQTLRSRLRGPAPLARRRPGRDGDAERGDLMVESIVWMAVIAIIVLAYTISTIGVNQTQRQSTATDIVDQQAIGLLEQAQAQPWATLGFANGQAGFDGSDPKSRVAVRTASAPAETQDLLKPTYTIKTRGVEMTVRAYVAWEDSSYPATTPASAYGTKVISIVVTYKAPGLRSTRTKSYSVKRTSSVAEALPTPLTDLKQANTRGPA